MSKICIIGNSVAAPRTSQEAPLAGWGQFLADFLTPYHEVRNYARDAMTARTYFTDRFATLLNLLEPGDIVLVNLGLVEQRIDNPLRYHGPKEFKEFLHLYVDGIRAEGAFPVLVTPVVRCAFAVDGNVADTRGVYPELMREVAAETGAAFVDLGAFTLQWLQELGPQRARRFFRWLDAGEHPHHPEGIIDSSHLNEAGARAVARMVAMGIHESRELPPGFVDVNTLAAVPEYPPVLTEFMVEKPEFALYSEVRTGAAPTVEKPNQSRLVGAMQKFAGTAEVGTTYILFFENGAYLGGTRVNAERQWQWRRVVNWPAGDHVVQAVGYTPQGVTAVSTVAFTVKDFVEPPVVLGPREGALSGPRPRFSGTAAAGVTQVMVLEGGRLIASAPVEKDGTWKVTHPHDWKPGTYTVDFVSIFSAVHSLPSRLTVRIHGIPEGNWIRESVTSREACSDKCDHLPFNGRW
ncbi:GDSL-type esterase/lipase family protein [Streptomyces sp. LN499]|uniref:GDSL-type esterase/lipase family protein n=1 Tax=Streptomyces sp. LN499 TaxID=3112977 RepID=UPI003722A17B